jgi:hypothetical protein
MIPAHVLSGIDAALGLLPREMDTPEARVMLLAIGLQESRFEHRRQLIKKGGDLLPLGPAKSYWQGEVTGGMCTGVKNHPASRYWANRLCQVRGVEFTARGIWNAIETDDVLAAGMARLLLFTDPKRLPDLGDEKGAWNLYMRTWRPGKPHRDTWPALYAEALSALGVEA